MSSTTSSNRSWKVGSHTSHRVGRPQFRCRVHGSTRVDLATYNTFQGLWLVRKLGRKWGQRRSGIWPKFNTPGIIQRSSEMVSHARKRRPMSLTNICRTPFSIRRSSSHHPSGAIWMPFKMLLQLRRLPFRVRRLTLRGTLPATPLTVLPSRPSFNFLDLLLPHHRRLCLDG